MVKTYIGDIMFRNGWDSNEVEILIPPVAFGWFFQFNLAAVEHALDNHKADENGEKVINGPVATAIHFLIGVFEADSNGITIFYQNKDRENLHRILQKIMKVAEDMPDTRLLLEEHMFILESLPVAQ